MARTLITNIQIFDGSGRAPFSGEVLIEDNRIARVAETASEGRIEAADATVIDGAGATLMPGMVEAHAHLSWPSSIERFIPDFVLPPEEQLLATVRNARVLLESGFTSAYSAGALGERIEVVVRNEIDGGWTPGPRLRASTIERSPEGDPIATGDIHHGRGADAMKAFVKFCKEIGIDQVKLQISGEDALLPGSSQHILYTEEEAQAAGEQARESDIWLSAHTQASEAIKMALRAGVRVLYHCTYADAEALDLLEAAKDEIFVAPAIGVIVATLEAKPPPHIDMTSMKEAAVPVIELSKKLIPELKRRGIRVLPGGDYGFPFNPNGTNARDLQHFVDLFGYTPTEALVAATKLGGELMGRAHELGLVEPGYLADLLLVDGDPTQDVSILQRRDRLLMIMKDGKMHKAPAQPIARAA
ncbi:amidohydrolase family protein [Caulobacter hibisci]|uniref:Amidohydrolase family protein n=1 Tax=Caulobacter hibisci TaxID=2035993 RepID=A0ABS0SY81_9CAUL|nr:amidohydrolase family protein [Caulobacter hibisci]